MLALLRVLFYYRGIESLGVGYLMSMLKHHGHQVDLVFEPGLDDNGYIRVPALRALNRPEALMERARAFEPDVIAVGSPTNLWPHQSRLAARLKRELDVPVVVGGHHAQAQGLPPSRHTGFPTLQPAQVIGRAGPTLSKNRR